jgi:hypothetical protein
MLEHCGDDEAYGVQHMKNRLKEHLKVFLPLYFDNCLIVQRTPVKLSELCFEMLQHFVFRLFQI